MGYKNKEKQRKFQKLWHRKRRNNFFKNKQCADCGSKVNLGLHHLDPSQKEHHNIWSWEKSRRELELKKCVVLCSVCHIKRHQKSTIELLDSIRKYYKKYGEIPTSRSKELITSMSVYQRRFGSWNKAIIAAGFKPRTNPPTIFSADR